MNEYFLKDISKIDISSVDKKAKVNEQPIRLCNFIDVYNNWAISKKMYDKFMKATANQNEINRYKLKRGMIAITKDSETRDDIGMSTYIADSFEDVILGYHTALIIPNPSLVDSRYLNAYLNSTLGRKHFSNSASGSGQRYTLTIESIGNLAVYLPPLNIQKKIGNILSQIDRKLENNIHINNNLEELMKTLYQRWFIEFNFPNEDGIPYKSSGGEMVWNDELKQEIPEGWKVENLYKNSLSSVIKNGIERFNKKIYLETADINNDSISNGNEILFNNRPSRANMQPQLNSVWFAKMKNSVKHLSLSDSSNVFVNRYILSTGMYGLQCNKITFPYMHSFINSIYFELTKDKLAHGATQQAVNDNDIKNIKIICPNNEILEKYSSKTYSILEEKNLIQEENKKLSELRDFLLPMLMNGQINVDDVEI